MKIEKPTIRDEAEHNQHEKRRRGIERCDKAEQVQDRAGAELADGIGHGSERADRRGLHDDGDDAEDAMRRVVDEGAQGVAALAKAHDGKAEQN